MLHFVLSHFAPADCACLPCAAVLHHLVCVSHKLGPFPLQFWDYLPCGIKCNCQHAISMCPRQLSCLWHINLSIDGVADPETWQPVVGPKESVSLAASLVGYLASQCHLFSNLAHLLLGACHPAPAAEQTAAQISLPEALASNLTVRFLSLKGHPEVAAAEATLPRLLCVPLLWSRCPRVLLRVSTLLCAMPKPVSLLTPSTELACFVKDCSRIFDLTSTQTLLPCVMCVQSMCTAPAACLLLHHGPQRDVSVHILTVDAHQCKGALQYLV